MHLILSLILNRRFRTDYEANLFRSAPQTGSRVRTSDPHLKPAQKSTVRSHTSSPRENLLFRSDLQSGSRFNPSDLHLKPAHESTFRTRTSNPQMNPPFEFTPQVRAKNPPVRSAPQTGSRTHTSKRLVTGVSRL